MLMTLDLTLSLCFSACDFQSSFKDHVFKMCFTRSNLMKNKDEIGFSHNCPFVPFL